MQLFTYVFMALIASPISGYAASTLSIGDLINFRVVEAEDGRAYPGSGYYSLLPRSLEVIEKSPIQKLSVYQEVNDDTEGVISQKLIVVFDGKLDIVEVIGNQSLIQNNEIIDSLLHLRKEKFEQYVGIGKGFYKIGQPPSQLKVVIHKMKKIAADFYDLTRGQELSYPNDPPSSSLTPEAWAERDPVIYALDTLLNYAAPDIYPIKKWYDQCEETLEGNVSQ